MTIIILAILMTLHTAICVTFGMAVSTYFFRTTVDKFLHLVETKEYLESLVRKEIRENKNE